MVIALIIFNVVFSKIKLLDNGLGF